MGRFFSDAVEQALDLIYYHIQAGSGAEGFKLLSEAAKAGDGDAEYFLSRCFSGSSYVWRYHGFPEDDDTVSELIHRAIAHGSAAAVLGAMRCGELTPSAKKTMPFSSLKEAWEVVYKKAEGGEPFCQYMIGNTYFWGDTLEIDGFDPDQYPSQEAVARHLRDEFLKALPWFERAFDTGLDLAGNNINNYYRDGRESLGLPAQPDKIADTLRRGAEHGYPNWMTDYGSKLLEDPNRQAEGLEWAKRAAEKGQLDAWIDIGDAYANGKSVPVDMPYALQCYEKVLARQDYPYGFMRVGKLCYFGNGVPQDYARAVQCFERSRALGNDWANAYLAVCYLCGYGCQRDPARAKSLVEEVKWTSPEKNFVLGVLYAQGLGGAPQDIANGVAFLQKAGDYRPAKEELMHYKKGFFGKWKRR